MTASRQIMMPLMSVRFAAPAFVLIAAVGYSVWFIPEEMLDPRSVAWVFGGQPASRDNAAHAIMAMGFAQEPWSWPPGLMTNFGGVVGGALITGAVSPILAFPAKALESLGILGPFWQFIGIQACIGICLTTLSVYFLSRTLSATRFASVCAALMALAIPALSRQVINESLTWQFLTVIPMILLLLDSAPARPTWPWVVLAGVAVWTNTYFLIPIAAFYCGRLWVCWRRHAVQLTTLARQSLALLAVVLSLHYLGGGFAVPVSELNTGGELALKTYRANALALIDSHDYGVTPRLSNEVSDEGFSYLGISVIAVLVVAGLIRLRGWLRNPGASIDGSRPDTSLRGNWHPRPQTLRLTLLIACLLYLYALSPTIQVGTLWEIGLPIPDSMQGSLSAFRAVGRFSWPLMYLLIGLAAVAIDILCAMVAAILPSPKLAVAAILVLLLLAQFWEQSSFARIYRQYAGSQFTVASQDWLALDSPVRESGGVEFVPAFAAEGIDDVPWRALSYGAINNGVRIDTYHWLARFRLARMAALQADGILQAQHCRWRKGHIYVVTKTFLPQVAGCRYSMTELARTENWTVLRVED